MKEYCGDVYVTVQMRWRVIAEFERLGRSGKPSKEDMLELLRNDEQTDVDDEEVLELLTVDSVGDNCVD